jgi:hypothetical protein
MKTSDSRDIYSYQKSHRLIHKQVGRQECTAQDIGAILAWRGLRMVDPHHLHSRIVNKQSTTIEDTLKRIPHQTSNQQTKPKGSLYF